MHETYPDTFSYVNTVSFSKDVFSQGAEYQVFFGVFLMFLAFFHSKIWAKFHFGTFTLYCIQVRKMLGNFILKKSKIAGVAENGLISVD